MNGIKKIFADSESLIAFLVLSGLTVITAILLGKYLQKKLQKKQKTIRLILQVLFF